MGDVRPRRTRGTEGKPARLVQVNASKGHSQLQLNELPLRDLHRGEEEDNGGGRGGPTVPKSFRRSPCKGPKCLMANNEWSGVIRHSALEGETLEGLSGTATEKAVR